MEERMTWGSLANLGKVSARFVKNSRPLDAARTFLQTLARTLQRWKRRSKPWNAKPDRKNVSSGNANPSNHPSDDTLFLSNIDPSRLSVLIGNINGQGGLRQSQRPLHLPKNHWKTNQTTTLQSKGSAKNDRGTVRRMGPIPEGLRESPQGPWFSRFANGVSSIDGITWQTRIDN